MMTTIETFLTQWTDAEQHADMAWLDAHLTDDFVGIGPLGFALPKPAWVGRHRGDLHYERFALDEVDIRSHGDTAIVVARHDARGEFQGTPLPEALRATVVAERRGDDWRLATLHLSFIAGTPGAPPIPGAHS